MYIDDGYPEIYFSIISRLINYLQFVFCWNETHSLTQTAKKSNERTSYKIQTQDETAK